MIVSDKSQENVAGLSPRDRARWFDCERKVAYPTQGLAAEAAQLFMNAGGPGAGITVMAAYRCHWCSDWHITKKINGESTDGYVVIPFELTSTKLKLVAARIDKNRLHKAKRGSHPDKNKPGKRKGGRYFDE